MVAVKVDVEVVNHVYEVSVRHGAVHRQLSYLDMHHELSRDSLRE
jgi:hypothetical protein